MARKPRIHYPGALYHVISRGNQRQDIFLDDKDRTAYLSYLSECKVRYAIELYAYALMKNHVHLLLEVNKIPLSKFMQTLLFRYARYFNKRYKKVGHLFQGRYRAILCDKDAYLLELVRYIHLNPVRAKVVRDPERYRWTSHLSYLGKDNQGLVDTDLVLGQFGEKKPLSRRRYWEFIFEGVGSGHQQRFYEVKDQRYLGEEKFIQEIEKEKGGRESVVYEIPIEVIARGVSRAFGVAIDRVYSLTYERQGAHGRGIVAYLARGLGGWMVKDIAGHFRRSPMRISQAIIEVEKRLRENESIKKMVEKLEKDLIKQAKRKYFITIA
jgi:putative transposase